MELLGLPAGEREVACRGWGTPSGSPPCSGGPRPGREPALLRHRSRHVADHGLADAIARTVATPRSGRPREAVWSARSLAVSSLGPTLPWPCWAKPGPAGAGRADGRPDPVLRRDLWAMFHRLAADGASLLVSSHVMDEAARCDHLLFMREGRFLAAASPDEMLAADRCGRPGVGVPRAGRAAVRWSGHDRAHRRDGGAHQVAAHLGHGPPGPGPSCGTIRGPW